jgi:ABC-2 type transport system ATP-binding protein
MATQPVLELRGVRKSYGELVAVDLLDLEVQPGECVALIGHNGSGKTTTLRLVAGLLEPSDGRVRVAGGDLAQERSRAALSFVPDSPLLYPDLTVREHLELVGLAHGVGVGLDGRVADPRGAALLRHQAVRGLVGVRRLGLRHPRDAG